MTNPTTLVMGASPDPSRYSYLAVRRLKHQGIPVFAYGREVGSIDDVPVHTSPEDLPQSGIDTVTLYLGAPRQKQYYDYFKKLKPRRIIFNPGAENEELRKLAEAEGISCEESCTLVLLSMGVY